MEAWSREIVVTADDYGLHPAVDEAVEALAAAGRIDAVSVMAHRDAGLGAVRRLAGTGVALGLHLCFTGVRPFVGALADGSGLLPADHRRLFAAVARRPAILSLLRAEAEAQAERLASEGIAVDFVNGHEHAHLFPALWPLCAALARRLGVRAVRTALGQPLGLTPAGALAAASRVSWALSPLRGAAVWSPLGVGLAGGLGVEAVEALLDRPFHGAAGRIRELCFHPSLQGSGRRAEHELLAQGEIDRILARRGLQRGTGLPH